MSPGVCIEISNRERHSIFRQRGSKGLWFNDNGRCVTAQEGVPTHQIDHGVAVPGSDPMMERGGHPAL